ncbi:MAG: type 4a pilus biogenesis protein PilO [Armatimonadetes bacterium]|nr:type 4a pilus biogenesis protein PilO [Armatimonadota bacterium]
MTNSFLNFKNPQEAGPSAVMLAALVILTGSLGYMLLVKKPTTEGIAMGKERSRKELLEQIERTQLSGQQTRAQLSARLWQGDPDTIAAAVLAQLTQEATARKLKLSAFRPQRTQTLPELSELPFSVQISGPYPAVHAFAATLDRPSSKLALRSLQLASSDAASNAVTATLGLSAYAPSQPPTVKNTPAKQEGAARG